MFAVERRLPLIITTCTNRKRRPVASELHAGGLPRGELAEVAAAWGKRLTQATVTYPADTLYGGAPLLGMARQALHAARLGFAHPHTGQAMQFEAPLPADMAAAWAELEGAPK